MKFRFLIFLVLITSSLHAQLKPQDIWGSWILTKVTFADNTELPDENMIKYAFIKYTFAKPNQMYYSGVYNEAGTNQVFELANNQIIVQSDAAFILNTMQVKQLHDRVLIIVQKGSNGFNDADAIKYHFIKEDALQDSLRLTDKDIFSAVSGDTVYKESRKLYPSFIGSSFQDYLSKEIGTSNLMYRKSGYIKASFIVRKSGLADSLKIINNISPKYDKVFTRLFLAGKNNWTPAYLAGKPVDVQKFIEIRYLNSEQTIPAYFTGNQANQAYNLQDYQSALALYDKALESVPTDKDNLYKRGMCKKNLGDIKGAVEDWKKIKELGGTNVDVLLEKYTI